MKMYPKGSKEPVEAVGEQVKLLEAAGWSRKPIVQEVSKPAVVAARSQTVKTAPKKSQVAKPTAAK